MVNALTEVFERWAQEPAVLVEVVATQGSAPREAGAWMVVSAQEDVDRRLGVDVDAVLTPHVLHPAENVPTDDVKMLQYGIYNLGFVAFHGTPEVREVVRWWSRRLERECHDRHLARLRSGNPHNYLRMVEHIVALRVGMGVAKGSVAVGGGAGVVVRRGAHALKTTTTSSRRDMRRNGVFRIENLSALSDQPGQFIRARC